MPFTPPALSAPSLHQYPLAKSCWEGEVARAEARRILIVEDEVLDLSDVRAFRVGSLGAELMR